MKSASRLAMLALVPTTDTDPLAAPDTAAANGAEPPATPADDLSPAVRRLVRQFDLDVTGVHGTGPSGRIRVSDVMGLIEGRTDTGKRDAPPRPHEDEDEVTPEALDGAAATVGSRPAEAPVAEALAAPSTTVFECDLSRVLSHRKRLRSDNVEILLTSYFAVALAEALRGSPELTAGAPVRLGIAITAEGEPRTALLDLEPSEADAVLDQRLRTLDAALRANIDTAIAAANLLVHHYGETGSLLLTPTPIGADHAASVGIGRVRREIAVRTVDGVETPRVAARCYVSLSFHPERVEPQRAHRFLGRAVRVLEQWSE